MSWQERVPEHPGKLRTEKQELDFFGHALLVLSDDTVELARASIAGLLRLPTTKAHLRGNGRSGTWSRG